MYKYQELYHIIKKDIKIGKLKQGTKLYSVRELCKKYNFSKVTVAKAIELLKEKNLIYSIPQSGYYITSNIPKLEKENNKLINFVSVSLDPKLFPYLDFQQCINQSIKKYKEDLFTYGNDRGLDSLIELMKKFLTNYQIYCKKKNIFITSGVQQALSLLIDMPFPNKKETILIAQPTYYLINKQLEILNKPIEFIERTKDGFDLEKLEEIFKNKNIKFFYIMPRFHNPLGFSLSEDQKKRIVYLAERYDVYLVEDDFLSDLETVNKRIPMYYYDDSNQRVIYLKSFSKIIFPGLRIGIAVIPDKLIQEFFYRKKFSDLDTSRISQASLEIYIKSGMFKKHSTKLNQFYRKKAILLHKYLLKESRKTDRFIYEEVETGSIHRCIELDKKINVDFLKKNGVLCSDISNYYSTYYTSPRNYLTINVANINIDMIEESLKKLFFYVYK